MKCIYAIKFKVLFYTAFAKFIVFVLDARRWVTKEYKLKMVKKTAINYCGLIMKTFNWYNAIKHIKYIRLDGT